MFETNAKKRAHNETPAIHREGEFLLSRYSIQ
jgi:hypothetical protein